MKIIIVGGTGTIGAAAAEELSTRHEVITVGHSTGDLQVDICDDKSIVKMYKSIGTFDAVIAATGRVQFKQFAEMSAEDYQIGLNSKLMGQVNLVLLGLPYSNDKGSFTLTSGILSDEPIVAGSSAGMVNSALNGFVKSAAIEMPRGIRINVVSPTILSESMEKLAAYFRGFLPVPASQVALAYSKSVEGAQTGQVYKVGYP